MTTEEDFQRELDACPANHLLRTIFADFLQDLGDPRTEGYRALGVLRKDPSLNHAFFGFWNADYYWFDHLLHRGHLPGDWYNLLKPQWEVYWPANPQGRGYSRTRRKVEDRVARVFAKLPPERRAELLKTPLVCSPSEPAVVPDPGG